MDITQFLDSQRALCLQSGDYGSYRRQLGRRLLALRKKLRCTSTAAKKEFSQKEVTAEDVKGDQECGISTA